MLLSLHYIVTFINLVVFCFRELRTEPEQVNATSDKIDRVLAPRFQILNLVPDSPQIVQEDFEIGRCCPSISKTNAHIFKSESFYNI